MSKTLRFTKSQRLLSNQQIKAVLDQRRRLVDGYWVLYVAPNQCGWPRLGISVGRAIGGAVIRNRIKRLLRETFRLNQHQIPVGLDYVLMVAPRGRRRSGQARHTVRPQGNLMRLTQSQVQAAFMRMVQRLPEAKVDKNKSQD